MEPRIQYAKTSDGVSIAFWTLGQGKPLVQMPRLPFSHIQMEWQIPELRTWYERLAATRTLVRYDARGTGLSDRDATDSSLDAQVMDLEAVVDRHGLDRFALFGIATSGPAAISFAARQPKRLSHLLLWCAYARASDFFDSPRVQGMLALMDKDWALLTESAAQFAYGWLGVDSAHRYAAYLRESVTQSAALAAYHALAQVDVTDLLPQVRPPALVMHLRQIPHPSLDAARAIASGIPNARLAVLEGEVLAPWMSETDATHQAIDEFLGEGADAEARAEPLERGAFRTILFTDIVGHTEMMSRLGDERGREVLREQESITRDVLKQHSGTEVKTMGDGFMASFGSVTKAVECAIALQRMLAGREGEPLSVRVGLNAGEPIEEDGDLFGATVILASRIAAKAEGGEILVADTVRGLCSGKGFLFADRGEFVAKGFEDPVRLFEVRWQEGARG